MSLRSVLCGLIALLFTYRAEAQALAPAIPLPIQDVATVTSPGQHPTIGEVVSGMTAVHYLDSVTGQWLLWDPATWTSSASPIQMVLAEHCDWERHSLFCAGTAPFPLPPYQFPAVAGYSFQSGMEEIRILPGKARKVNAAERRAVIVFDQTNEVRLYSLTGGTSLSDQPIFVGSGHGGLDPHPVVSETIVAYQTVNANGDYFLEILDDSGPQPTAHPVGPYEPRPSQALGPYVSFNTQRSVLTAYTLDSWDPGGEKYDPTMQGCDSYRGLKSSPAGMHLVHATGCPEGASVLYALMSKSGSYGAYFVGTLSQQEPEYDVFRDEIVYVNENQEVVWVKADLTSIAQFTTESEPNDDFSTANRLLLGQIGGGAVPTSSGWTDEDYWWIELTPGNYDVWTGHNSPGEICPIWQRKKVTIYNAGGNNSCTNEYNTLTPEGIVPAPGDTGIGNWCGRLDRIYAPYTGIYFIRVTSDYTMVGPDADYVLRVIPHDPLPEPVCDPAIDPPIPMCNSDRECDRHYTPCPCYWHEPVENSE